MNVTIATDGTIVITDFNELQSYKIARKLEKDGMEFYSSVLAQSHDDDLNSAVHYLLEAEKDHLAFFQDRIDAIQADDADGFEEEDIADFINANIFSESDHTLRENIDFSKPFSALAYGLRIEIRSIAFYSALLENTRDEKGRMAFEAIIAEEEKHKATLQEFL
jgi:rubrerythrin